MMCLYPCENCIVLPICKAAVCESIYKSLYLIVRRCEKVEAFVSTTKEIVHYSQLGEELSRKPYEYYDMDKFKLIYNYLKGINT